MPAGQMIDDLMSGDERVWLRAQIEEIKGAALIGYGALLAHNTSGQYDLVLKAMRGPLFPGDKEPGRQR